MKSWTFLPALLLGATLLLAGCGGTVLAVKPPACPTPSNAFGEEIAHLNAAEGAGTLRIGPAGPFKKTRTALPAFWATLDDMVKHCDAIEVIRRKGKK